MAGQLKRHMLIHTQDKPHICVDCKKGFNTRYAMKLHRMSAHSQQQQEEVIEDRIHTVHTVVIESLETVDDSMEVVYVDITQELIECEVSSQAVAEDY